MLSLRGVGVLVTRPEQQALPLCRLLEDEGATTRRLPVIEISPTGNQHALHARLGPVTAFDLIVFTSANAVRFGSALLGNLKALPLSAIGPATARALARAGYRVAIQPNGGFDSETLLAHPSLEHVAGRRVLLVKGVGGRELLQDELRRRGAEVTAAEVYERRQAVPSPAALAELATAVADGGIDVVTATSLEIAIHLLRLVTPDLRSGFDRMQWLVPSARVAEGLRERGLRAPLLPADSAEDQDLLAAIKRWRSSVSGA